MSNLSTVGVNYFQLGMFHKMLFDILNTYSYVMFSSTYENLNAEDKDSVWNQIRIIFDSRIDMIGGEPFDGYKLIEE